MLNTPRRITVLLAVALALLAACGNDPIQTGGRTGLGCKDEIPFEATFLPSGFDETLTEGPAEGKDEIEASVIYHWSGRAEDEYIEVFRGAARNKLKGNKARILKRTGRIGKISGGGYAAKVKLGRGTCTRYQIEAFGVSEKDFVKVVAGLQRVATASPEADE
jgi:hypothetical protein